MHTINFNTLAKAFLLSYELRDSLFAGQTIFEKTGLSKEMLCREFLARFNVDPDNIIHFLQPENIKSCITDTSLYMHNTKPNRGLVSIEAMTDDDMQNLSLSYQFSETPFGSVVVVSASGGVCYLAFADKGEEDALNAVKKRFPKALLQRREDAFQDDALSFFRNQADTCKHIQLHLKATPFQLGVWRRLMEIPAGGLMSYSALAGNRKDSHAFGNAVGSNPIAYIIPCHRTVAASGEFGEYHWGKARKAVLICLERQRAAFNKN